MHVTSTLSNNNSQRPVSMDLHIPDLLPRARTVSKRLLLAQLQTMRKQEQRQSLQAGIDIGKVPAAHLLELRILGPDVAGPLELLEVNVLEPGSLEHLLVVRCQVDRPTQIAGCFDGHDGHLVQEVGLGQGAVIAAHWQSHVYHFEVTAGLEVAEGRSAVSLKRRRHDNTYSYAFFMKAWVSAKLPPNMREKMKSKGLDHTHSFSTSSTSKVQLSGTLPVWL
jgi:hypothetical protein